MPEYATIKGLAELSNVLKRLPRDVAEKHMKGAVGAAAILVREEAKLTQKFRDRTGLLRASIITKHIPERSSWQQATYFVTVRHGKRNRRRRVRAQHFDPTTGRIGSTVFEVNLDAYYWFFVEFGTAKAEARPFMRPAFEKRKHDALRKIQERLEKGIKRSVGDLVRAGGISS